MMFPVRRKNRLAGFDYSSPNVYLITICTKGKQCILWDSRPAPVGATNGRPPHAHLSAAGMAVRNAIEGIPAHYPMLTVDNYVIMPNHVHLLLHIHADESVRPMVAPTVSQVVAQMKGAASKAAGVPLWQKGFHDHIVRSAEAYARIWMYIDGNPYAWETDCFYLPTDSLFQNPTKWV